MTQHVLQSAIGKNRRARLQLGPVRQTRNPDRLPGLLVAFAWQVQGREDRRDHPHRTERRHKKRQAEYEQRAPRQRRAITRR
ncbi:hypothetical protein D3C76_1750010 [compost metagenome]